MQPTPKELFKNGKIPCDPKLDPSELDRLVKYRNGLVHAAASRPASDSQPSKTKPYPTRGDLERLAPGWALRVVVSLVRSLHEAVGEPVPDYIESL